MFANNHNYCHLFGSEKQLGCTNIIGWSLCGQGGAFPRGGIYFAHFIAFAHPALSGQKAKGMGSLPALLNFAP